MKYIRRYEYMIDVDLEINEYVICTDIIEYEDDYNHDEYINFLNTNIGQFIGMNNSDVYNYSVIYKNVPGNIKEYFTEGRTTRMNIPPEYQLFKAARNDIIYHSKSKEEIEHYISANKYNL